MAPFVPLADGALVDVVGVLGSVPVVNNLYFVSEQPPVTLAQLQSLADGVSSWWISEVVPALSSEFQHTLVRATDYTAFPAPANAFNATGAFGGSSSPTHSAKVAVKVNFRWPINFRLKEGANYVGGIPKADVSVNRYSDAIRSSLFEAYADLIDLAGGFGPFPAWRWVVTSRDAGGVPRSTRFARSSQGPAFRSPIVATRRKRAA